MTDSSVVDTDVVEAVAPPVNGIPMMGAKSQPVEKKLLGPVETETRAKTNLGLMLKVGIVMGLIVLLAGGLLAYQKLKPQKTAGFPVAQKSLKPIFATKNEEVQSEDLNSKKAALLKKEQEENERMAAMGIKAEENASAQGDVQRAVSPGQTECVGENCPVSPSQRKLLGEVIIPLPSLVASQATQNGAGDFVNGGNVSANYPKPPDVNQLMRQLNASSGMSGLSPSSGSSPSLSAQLKPTVLESRYAGKLSDMDYLLKRGAVIPCSLKTGIDTTLAGLIICTATNDVYSANGKLLLIARGAMIHGEQQSSLKLGQARVFALWTRIDNPDGTTAELDSPASDAMGFSGIPGYVDEHFGERFGSAMLISIIKDGSSFALSNLARNNGNGGQQFNPTNTANTGSSMAQDALKSTINIPPTLVVRPASLVNVLVARDISFEKVYRVVK